MWGQDDLKPVLCYHARIIPMRVGTSFLQEIRSPSNQDHPHACGDKKFVCLVRWQNEGSSPCVWGQALEGVSFDNCDRIIPMRVGTREIEKGSANLG